MPFISILTPTYNRGKLLLPLYESLKNLTFEDFEWLIVDDGSEDDTEQYALSWIAHNIQNAEFPIRYIKKVMEESILQLIEVYEKQMES